MSSPKKLSIRPKKVTSPEIVSMKGWSSSAQSPNQAAQKQHHLKVKIPKITVDMESQEVDLGFNALRNHLAHKKRYSSIYSKANPDI